MSQGVSQFELLARTWVESVSGELSEFHHECGARHLHLECSDDNLTLGILIPTAARDSKGTPHVVEHLVMQGSERFRMKSLFALMRERSLATYLEGFIRSDSTGYVASSRNKRDFMNLATIVLDSVFFPLLEEEAFRREAWRLEFEKPDDDPPKGLRYQGVLLNELKGGESSSAPHVVRALRKALFPGRPESNDPEGIPSELTKLTLEEVQSFHAAHYQPSRTAFFSYGKMSYEEIQDKILSEVLVRHKPTSTSPSDSRRRRRARPRDTYVASYPCGPGESVSRGQSLVAWLIDASEEGFDLFGLDILAKILIANGAGPVGRELLSTGDGDGLSDHAGFMMLHSQGVFSAGLKGVELAGAGEIPDLVRARLSELLSSGIDQHDLERALHQIEVEERHYSNEPIPHSIQVFMNLASGLLHSSNPLLFVDFDRNVTRLRHLHEEGDYLGRLIETHLVEGPKETHVVLRPDASMASRRETAEAERLERLSKDLSSQDRQSILEQQTRLRSPSEESPDLSQLPSLARTDLLVHKPVLEYSSVMMNEVEFGIFSQETNGLTFVDLQTSFSRLETALVQDLGLFAYAHPRMGTTVLSAPDRANWMGSNVGSFKLIPSVWRHGDSPQSLVRSLRIAIKLLSAKESCLKALLDMCLSETIFDPSDLRAAVRELCAEKMSYVTQAGMLYAVLLASSQIGPLGILSEQLNGISQLKRLQRQAKYGTDEFGQLALKMYEIQRSLFRRVGWKSSIISAGSLLEGLRDQVVEAISALEDRDVLGAQEAADYEAEPGSPLEGVAIESNVAYNALAFRGPQFDDEDAPKMKVLCKVLSQYLHQTLKGRRGAYGAEANFDVETGLVALWTYRDPNIADTFRYFQEMRTEIGMRLTNDEVETAVLSAYAEMDPLLSPETRARSRFFNDISGYTSEMERNFIRTLLEVRLDDLMEVFDKYLKSKHYGGATIGPLSEIEKFASAAERPVRIRELLST